MENQQSPGEKSTTADPYKQKVKTGDKDKEFVRLMPNVTMEMQCADYWINKSDNPDEVIMSADGIKRFNNSILTEKSEFLKYSKLRENYNGGIISGIDLEKYLRETEIPAGECFVNGNEVDETYWDRLIDNENFEVIQDENQLQYGFATERASMRGFPTEDIVYTGDEFTFYDEIQMSSLLVGEPVIIAHESKDGKWLFVITQSCTGWTLAENVAISQNYDKWIKESDPARFLIVTEDEITLEYDPKNKLISEKKLTMGTKLPLVPITENTKSSEGRQAYGNYLVKIPSRSKDGPV